MAKRTNWVAWGLAAMLAAVLVCSGMLFFRLSGWQVTALCRQHWGFGKEPFSVYESRVSDIRWFRLGVIGARQEPTRRIIWMSAGDASKP